MTSGAGPHPGGAHPEAAEWSAGARPGEAARQPGELTRGGKPSGLLNPSRAMRSLGSITLVMEAIVLLLAMAPLRMLQGTITSPQLIATAGGAVLAILLTGLLAKPIGWKLGSALQIALLACGVLHWAIGAVGLIFGLVWLYVLHVRRRVLL